MNEIPAKIPPSVLLDRTLKGRDKAVYAYLQWRQGNGDCCWPKLETIARELGESDYGVRKSIKALVKAGHILRFYPKTGRSHIPRYRVHKKGLDSTHLNLKGSDSRHPSGPKGSGFQHQKGLDFDTQNPTHRTPYTYTFILRDKTTWDLPKEKILQYRDSYPQIDIETELGKARQWLLDNPGKRKTARGMSRFINGWLNRAKPQSKETDTVSLRVDTSTRDAYLRGATHAG